MDPGGNIHTIRCILRTATPLWNVVAGVIPELLSLTGPQRVGRLRASRRHLLTGSGPGRRRLFALLLARETMMNPDPPPFRHGVPADPRPASDSGHEADSSEATLSAPDSVANVSLEATADSSGTAKGGITPSSAPARGALPWVTGIYVAICIGVFFGINAQPNPESWAALARFGVLPGDEIWRGAYWAVIPSAAMHVALWHLVFNVYWLWQLGCRTERAIGHWRYLALVLASAAVSSTFQLAASDTTGIGASGVVYALFGFLWIGRRHDPGISDEPAKKTTEMFLIWLGTCFVLTHLNILQVGNASHLSGILFGSAVAGALVGHERRPLMAALAGTMVIAAGLVLFWCPWSIVWLSGRAYDAHVAKRYPEAYSFYSQIIDREPSVWAYENRSAVNEALGEPERAQADLLMARQLEQQGLN